MAEANALVAQNLLSGDRPCLADTARTFRWRIVKGREPLVLASRSFHAVFHSCPG